MTTSHFDQIAAEAAARRWFANCHEPEEEKEDGIRKLTDIILTAIEKAMSDDTWKHKIADFVNLILHGDDEHKAWLREAGEAFLFGKPIPPARGGAKKEPVVGLNHVTLRFPDCEGKPCKVIPTLSGNLQVGSAAAIVTSDEFEAIALLRIKALGQSPPATDDKSQCICDHANGLHWGKCPLNMQDKPRIEQAKRVGPPSLLSEEIAAEKAAHASKQGAEWIPLADGRGKCGVKDKEGWIARGLTEHQAMTISAAHNAALAAEREKRKEAETEWWAMVQREREKLKPLVEALEELRTWTDPHDHERVIIDDALAKVKEGNAKTN